MRLLTISRHPGLHRRHRYMDGRDDRLFLQASGPSGDLDPSADGRRSLRGEPGGVLGSERPRKSSKDVKSRDSVPISDSSICCISVFPVVHNPLIPSSTRSIKGSNGKERLSPTSVVQQDLHYLISPLTALSPPSPSRNGCTYIISPSAAETITNTPRLFCSEPQN